MIQTSAPGKLMLLGEHAVVYGQPCLVTAVGQRMYVIIETISNSEMELKAIDVKIIGYKKSLTQLGEGDIPKGALFVEMAVKNFKEKYGINEGVRITTKSEFSSLFGFGSSSASTVCVIKGLAKLTNKKLNNKELFDLAYKTVLDIQGKGSGFDISAAVYGGTQYYIAGGKTIETISLNKLPLVVGYSGIKADTPFFIQKVAEAFKHKQKELNRIFAAITLLVEEAKISLEMGNFEKTGNCMTQNHTLLQKLGVSIPKLDEMVGAANRAGAWGAKLSGAGGGDCMIALVSDGKKDDVVRAIKKAGGEVINVSFNAKGVE